MGNLTGRTALITGGSHGIGLAIAKRFADDGANVAIIDINEDHLSTASAYFADKGQAAKTLQADVTDKQQVEAAVKEIVESYGQLDILVNNAGVIRDNMFFKMSEDDWDMVMNVHLKGAFLATKAAQKYMVEQKYGRIVNISSTSALGNRGQANYSTAKAGLQGFTKTLAIELGKFNITANAIAPNFIETNMTRATAERIGVDFDDFVQARAKEIPVARSGKPEDIANTAAFFADERSSFVSGQVIYVAGGPKA
ncbi:3-oxoacyl-[acyl-carrier protein] reductase [Geomicrobium sp. JCM 19037]|uniref:SDR family oxidoreductase n=1 Tax=Geomicrobium sp. JCM 19037 TaxID=1460634 RepID=UPI00045F3119|nr:SDR family NAD(P)-dependent oxidoreductase [Geomicrobium sp. JCM 19037]GAK03078.1 3-oxoacyl-[acyl-carrier protein] reductase [Geomicrobium sp. JCM 19037]